MIKFKIYTIINNILLYSYWLLIAIVTFRILIKRRTIPSSMAWLLIIYILPLIGIITYFLFGESNLGKQRFNRSKTIWLSIINQIKELKIYQYMCTNQYSEIAFSLFQLCKNRQGIGALTGNKIKLLKNTNDIITSLTKDIKLARYTIDIVFYIWQPGGLVDYVANELIRAAKRGVRCRLMLDSAGSTNFFRSPYHKIMKKAGVNIVKALHINLFRIFLRRMDLRQHRKMILIDNHIAYTGSMNMADPQLFKKKMGIGPWIDIMVRINGPVTAAMGIIFSSDWEIETGEQTILKSSDINIIKFKKTSGHTIQIIPSGPGFPEGMIHQALLTSLYTARKKIIITTPYLVPSDDLSYAICTAAQRGVEVHIIVPYHNDSILVNWASRAFFSEFLEAGVFIHQFHNGLLHVKSILIDQQLSFIGTVNLDIRSLCLNFEITLVIDDYNFSNDLELIQQEYITCSKLLDPKKWENRPYWKRIIERIFYFFSPLL